MSTTQGKSVMVQGRIVWVSENLFKGKIKTDMNTKQPKVDKNGDPIREYGFGLAVAKTLLGQSAPGQPGEIWSAMHEEAFSLYPSRQLPPGFAMKYKDGDGVDHNGVSFSQREGYAGHVVFGLTTTIPIKFFKWENGNNILINEGIKCGDHVNVQVHVKAHLAIGQGRPGLYLNPMAVQLTGYGTEIINAPSGDQVFGNQAPPVPAGASATPIAPVGPLIPTPGQQMMYPGAPQGQPVQPYYGVIPQPHQPVGNGAGGAGTSPGFPSPMSASPASPSNGFPPIPGYKQ